VTATLQEIQRKFIILEAMTKKYFDCKNIILPNMIEIHYHTGQHLRYSF